MRRGSFRVRRTVAQLRCSIAQSGCGVAKLVVRRLAVRHARVRFSARHPRRLLLLSGEAMRIQEDGPRQIMKDERMFDGIVRMNVKNNTC